MFLSGKSSALNFIKSDTSPSDVSVTYPIYPYLLMANSKVSKATWFSLSFSSLSKTFLSVEEMGNSGPHSGRVGPPPQRLPLKRYKILDLHLD